MPVNGVLSRDRQFNVARDVGISLATTKDYTHVVLQRAGLPTRGALASAASPESSVRLEFAGIRPSINA